jgi:DNA-binding MarR family transcriptional regulator
MGPTLDDMARSAAPAPSGRHTPEPCSVVASTIAAADDVMPAHPLDDDLGWALGVVFRSYLRCAGEAMRELPGGPRGYQVLSAAVRDDPRPQAALAQHLGVDRTVMTYLLDDLEKAGVIERLPHPADRRVRLIGATDVGRRTLVRLDERLRHAEDAVLSSLPAQDAVTFRSLLQRLACQADTLAVAETACNAVADAIEADASRSA